MCWKSAHEAQERNQDTNLTKSDKLHYEKHSILNDDWIINWKILISGDYLHDARSYSFTVGTINNSNNAISNDSKSAESSKIINWYEIKVIGEK